MLLLGYCVDLLAGTLVFVDCLCLCCFVVYDDLVDFVLIVVQVISFLFVFVIILVVLLQLDFIVLVDCSFGLLFIYFWFV